MKIIYNDNQINKIALHCLKLINDRTLKGIDKDGEPFKAYSNKPFKMPFSRGTKRALDDLIKRGEAQVIKQNGVVYVIVKTGYLGYKKAYMQKTSYDGTVNMTLTGEMMRNFTVIETNDNSFTLGFTDTEMAQRAVYNQQKGRDFIGLSNADLNDLKFLGLISNGFDIIE